MLAGLSRVSVARHSHGHCVVRFQVKRLSLTLCLVAGHFMRGTDVARQKCRFKVALPLMRLLRTLLILRNGFSLVKVHRGAITTCSYFAAGAARGTALNECDS